MDAVVFKGKCHVQFTQVPMPTVVDPTNAVVKVELCGLCGSDMHPYHCREQGLDQGTVMGHEFVGTVVSTGTGVTRCQPGDRVMSPFTTCCGSCYFCRVGLTARCERGQLFGWVEGGMGLQGAQAQYIRVPLADSTLVTVPEGVSDEEALLLGDVFSTGFFAAHNAGIGGGGGRIPMSLPAAAGAAPVDEADASGQASNAGGSTACQAQAGANGQQQQQQQEEEESQQAGELDGQVVAVVGCGPVGLMAVIAARALGAKTILAIDSLPERLAMAAKLGAQPVDRGQQDPLLAVRAATEGRGADVALELVGAPSALRAAYDFVRPGGTISAVGCHTDPGFPFTPAEAYNKNITFKTGRCPARFYMEQLLPLVQSKQVDITPVISHRVPLREAARAYQLFDEKQEGCTKVVFKPWD
ncbi:hypothetical protein N2152v2_000795 [Parachlorella kessleri]